MSALPYAHLQAFLAVARTRSFSAAARDLGVSRSAVSQSIRQIEKDVGVVLVARTTRSVSLTHAGRRLADSLGPADAQIRAALAEVSAKPGEVVGSVRLSVAKAAYLLVLKPILPKFREHHPRIEIECNFDDRGSTSSARGSTPVSGWGSTSSATWSACGSPSRFGSSSSAHRATRKARDTSPSRRASRPRMPDISVRHHGVLYAWELERERPWGARDCVCGGFRAATPEQPEHRAPWRCSDPADDVAGITSVVLSATGMRRDSRDPDIAGAS
jgi:DNA-binding MarR family transcriptional regulator